jgi:hypothetical protein
MLSNSIYFPVFSFTGLSRPAYKLFLLFSTEISSTEYRDVAYVQYRDVQVPRCPDTILSDNFKSDTLFKSLNFSNDFAILTCTIQIPPSVLTIILLGRTQEFRRT